MEAKKIYLDINIVADIIDSSRQNHGRALQLLKNLILNNSEVCISEDMLSTLYYILKDKTKTLNFFKEVVFVDWHVLVFGKKVIQDAVDLSLEKNLDLEDALQCLCAKENECDAFITNDKKFYDCGVNVMSNEEFNSVIFGKKELNSKSYTQDNEDHLK